MVQRNLPSRVGTRARNRTSQAELSGAVRLILAQLTTRENTMHGIIYIVGLIVVIMAVLSLFGLR